MSSMPENLKGELPSVEEWEQELAAIPEDASNAVGNLDLEIQQSTGSQKIKELQTVMADLQQRYGNWKVEWGDICRYQRLTGSITESYDDKLPSLPVGLVSSAFGALPSFQSRVMPNTKKRYGFSGNSFIAAVEFGKKVKARTIVTGGESSDPASPISRIRHLCTWEDFLRMCYFIPKM